MDNKNLLWLSAIAMSLASCDTRDDWFLEHGEEPIIRMETSSDTLGGEYWEGKRYRVVEVGWGRPDTLSFSIEDPYGKECTYDFKITSIPEENIANGVHETELLYFLGPEICHWQVEEKMGSYRMGSYRENAFKYTDPLLKLTKSNGKVIFSLGKDYYLGGSIAGDYFESRALLYTPFYENFPSNINLKTNLIDDERHLVPFSKEVSARYTMTARNKIGVETTEYVLVKIKPNRMPVPSVSITCVDKETGEYRITAGGTDPDGHRIVKWSYLFDYAPYEDLGKEDLKWWHNYNYTVGIEEGDKMFDGCIRYDAIVTEDASTVSSSAYDENECFYLATFGRQKDDVEGWWKFKGIEVDFIKPTTRNEVNHIFQSKGEHTVSVRCKDEFGLWSDYTTQKIYIE
ncbi:MAG: hypothetical protein UH850_10595 [Paludibacteraceae bacterium]|nr:hypothetical protein [Paludibacteraceae bacterium]